jgi:hypothetical protein
MWGYIVAVSGAEIEEPLDVLATLEIAHAASSRDDAVRRAPSVIHRTSSIRLPRARVTRVPHGARPARSLRVGDRVRRRTFASAKKGGSDVSSLPQRLSCCTLVPSRSRSRRVATVSPSVPPVCCAAAAVPVSTAKNAATTTPYTATSSMASCCPISSRSTRNVNATRPPGTAAGDRSTPVTCGHGCDRSVCTKISSACTCGETTGPVFLAIRGCRHARIGHAS